jgi:poly(hydroxyalkanoate) depolymerase family esterase
MQETMRLMQSGDLRAATAAIQRGLAGSQDFNAQPSAGATTDTACIEGEYRIVRDDGPAVAPDAHAPARNERPGSGEFREHLFTGAEGSIHYKLFVPAGHAPSSLPLIVMLHGCNQSPDDFARGTRMNALAQQQGYVVAYPAQSQNRNASKCWNWFRAEDQQRGRGEPALLAGLTRHLLASLALDARRVFVAGMSAGGAMAAVLGSTYPDLFAAIGVHSGLPFGAARDLPSALAAMKQRPVPATGVAPANVGALPAIVFHGDRDATVDPCNGSAVVAQFVAPASDRTPSDPIAATVEHGATGGRRFTRTIFTGAEARVIGEQWVVHGTGHAWSGGDAAGSHTDPNGPDASVEMLRFFAGVAPPAQ